MIETNEHDLIGFIEEVLQRDPIRPDGFGVTPLEFAKSGRSRSRDTAARDLEKLAAVGVLKRRMMTGQNGSGSGWRGFVYARPEDWEKIGL